MSLYNVKTTTLILIALGILGAQHGIIKGTLGAGTYLRRVYNKYQRGSLSVRAFHIVNGREDKIM